MSGPDGTPRVLRFAPSPNGYLHRGHALSALLNARAAQATGGRFLLRVEDYDHTRSRVEFETAIFEDLTWLGLKWEEPVLRQSQRFDAYATALDELERLGLLYPAFMTRAEIAAGAGARDPDGAPLYPGNERDWSVKSARRRSQTARLTRSAWIRAGWSAIFPCSAGRRPIPSAASRRREGASISVPGAMCCSLARRCARATISA